MERKINQLATKPKQEKTPKGTAKLSFVADQSTYLAFMLKYPKRNEKSKIKNELNFLRTNLLLLVLRTTV